ncbi:hypothetical protein Pla52n_23390 [Stieleria varia]|uniref:Glycosyltransferase subfamily 4-like N-terminal domain-containing protein n=2 Tax=Stieleria varia TaxID=2528005 RepID=A0A5C6AX35_9BACT|nr:hypothetical protein Pla52n_23390 [Stieleria varia]
MRVLIVTHHFWPHGSIDVAGHAMELATGLHRRGVHVEVLTPKFSSRWVEQLTFREIAVHRPTSIAKNEWASNRYARQMTQWIRDRGQSFDVIVCQGGRDEAPAVVDAARRLGIPSVIRITGFGTASDVAWWQTGRWARRCMTAAKSADCVITSHAGQHRQLLGEGFLDSKIQRVGISVGASPAITNKQKQQVRFALGGINSDLFATMDTPVALAVCPLDRSFPSSRFASAMMSVVSRNPAIKVWLVGDGSGREATHRMLKSDGVRHAVAIPGSFSNLEDVYAAADMYIHASDYGVDHLLPAAISARLPLVLRDSPLMREFIDGSMKQETSGQFDTSASLSTQHAPVAWFDERPASLQTASQRAHDSPGTLGRAVESILKNREQADENAEQLRLKMQRQWSSNDSLDQYISLFGRLSGTVIKSSEGIKSSEDRQSSIHGDRMQNRSRSESGQ